MPLIPENGTKHVKTDSDEYEAEAVIIATGSESRKLGVPAPPWMMLVSFAFQI